MYAFTRSSQFLYFTFVLFHLTTSQLVGLIKQSSRNPHELLVLIRNPTNQTTSILAWNNVFDHEVPLPVSLAIRDDQGHHIRMATMYAMRAGMSNTDFHHLEPDAVFSRSIDLRSLIQVVPEGRSGNITVSLPGGFTGISHTANWTVPAAAMANLSADPPRLGDFSAAGLQDISLSARRLALELNFPLFADDGVVNPKPYDPLGGIEIDKSCPVLNGTSMADILSSVGIYANAISLAAKDRPSALFANYFLSRARQTVQGVALSVQKAISGKGPQIGVYCLDVSSVCGRNPNILGHTFTPSNLRPAEIVMCSTTRRLPRVSWPCSSHPGKQIGATATHVLLHLILTINSIFPNPITGSVYGSGSCQLLKNSHVLATEKNPDSYAQLAMAQWEYGLGGRPYNGKPCPPKLGIVPNIQ
ncbi:MAG: hypothetical protein LQ337_006410 [Flavoplaca oasis]|nr:MAG: hypothetical protein LQ337_006410 [Flavoplaca oasis]